jgi:nucleoid DNA-binding protein
MKQKEFLELLAKRSDIEKRELLKLCNEAKCLLLEVLSKGGKIELKDFGKIELKESKERLYRNPITKRLYYSNKKSYIKLKLFKKFKYMFA